MTHSRSQAAPSSNGNAMFSQRDEATSEIGSEIESLDSVDDFDLDFDEDFEAETKGEYEPPEDYHTQMARPASAGKRD